MYSSKAVIPVLEVLDSYQVYEYKFFVLLAGPYLRRDTVFWQQL